jgi:hypothetical protein
MDIQTAFRDEWNRKTVLWVYSRTNIPVNVGCVTSICFELKHEFFTHIRMCISYMQKSDYRPRDPPYKTNLIISQEESEQIIFSDNCDGLATYGHQYEYDTYKFFKNKREFYIDCRTSWLLLCVIYELCDGLRCAKLSNVEMVFRDSYMMKMIVLY